ncbi:hypothetical protein FB451DRAFT_1372565 [Mycena latifolia]|nr:hypothetical protein FB451DRAFT_1372565 [Mycena latifolia]
MPGSCSFCANLRFGLPETPSLGVVQARLLLLLCELALGKVDRSRLLLFLRELPRLEAAQKLQISRALLNTGCKTPFPSELPLSMAAATLKFIFGQHYKISNETEWATLVPPHHGRVKLGPLSKNLTSFYTATSSAWMPSEAQAAEACLGQIRKAILCTADITLEPADLVCDDDGEKHSRIIKQNDMMVPDGSICCTSQVPATQVKSFTCQTRIDANNFKWTS